MKSLGATLGHPKPVDRPLSRMRARRALPVLVIGLVDCLRDPAPSPAVGRESASSASESSAGDAEDVRAARTQADAGGHPISLKLRSIPTPSGEREVILDADELGLHEPLVKHQLPYLCGIAKPFYGTWCDE